MITSYTITDSIDCRSHFIHICTLMKENVTYLLNPPDKIENFIEKYVLDITCFHLKQLNRKLDDVYVEFWFKASYQTKLHLDCDEYDRKVNKSELFSTPFLSCVTYFNNSDYSPTILTNIDREKYKYKNFSDPLTLIFSFPKEAKQIVFEGGKYYHGACNLLNNSNDNRYIMTINFWDKKPLNVPYFNFKEIAYQYAMKYLKELEEHTFDNNLPIVTVTKNNDSMNPVTVNRDILSDDFFEILLYQGYNKDDFKCFESLFQETDRDILIFNTNSLCSDETNRDDKLIDISLPKFQQRFIFKNYFTKDICKWLVNEAEEYALLNNGWTTNRHKTYPTTDLPVDKISNVFRFIMTAFQTTISQNILKAYCMSSSDVVFDIKDIFIVKYEESKQTSLDFHTDDCIATCNILLNDPSEFEGGGTKFFDDLTYNLDIGDMIIHSSKHKHCGLEITRGKRYILVFFINIYDRNLLT